MSRQGKMWNEEQAKRTSLFRRGELVAREGTGKNKRVPICLILVCAGVVEPNRLFAFARKVAVRELAIDHGCLVWGIVRADRA